MNHNALKSIAIFVLLSLSMLLHAQIEPLTFYKRNYGPQLTNYNVALDTVFDDRYNEIVSGNSWRTYYKHGTVNDFIKLYVYDTNLTVTRFSYNFLIQVKSWNGSGSLSTFYVTMPLSYDPAKYQPYREVSVHRFTGAHKFVCTILSVTDAVTGSSVTFSNLKKKFAIQQSIQIERYFKSDYEETVHTDSIVASKPAPGKILIDWSSIAIKAPMFFELEWMHVDDYGAGIPQYVKDHTTLHHYFDTAGSISTYGWSNDGGGSASILDGSLHFTGAVALNRWYGITPGKTYRATVKIKNLTPGKQITLLAYDDVGGSPDLLADETSSTNAGNTELSVTFTSSFNIFDLGIMGESGATCDIDDVMIVDVTNEPAAGEPYYRPLELLTYNFRNNATRIRTAGASYLLEDVFENGYLVYRIRKVRPDSNTFLIEKSGPWTPYEEEGLLSEAKYIAVGAHTGDSLNWNYQATYAEDTRRKDMIGYYDGLLKPRQEVVAGQQDQTVIVGETKYDFNGRAAIQILPVPALRNDNDTFYHNRLTYYPNFNRNRNGQSYSASDFDSLMWVCPSDMAGELDTTSGASQYYSGNNPDKTGQQKFVPDAAQYPMIHTEFMPDNTGRVRRQGGVGIDHQLGSGHETVYNYSQPVQEELARVFGSEAGSFSHYKKQTVTDANGQISVSYLDLQGRVVATALSDRSPENLDELPENRPANLLISNLSDKNTRTSEGIQLTFEKQVNRDTGSLYIDYRMQTSAFRDACMPINLCYKCVYNYEITLFNKECNEVVFHFKDTIGFLNPADTVCGTLVNLNLTDLALQLHGSYPKVDTTVYDSLIRVSSLGKGTYALQKKLYVNPDAYEFFFNQYVQQQECGKTFDVFFAAELANTDFSGCNNCDTCEADDMSYCDAMLELMKADVSPGGQYCQVEYIDSMYVAIDTITSVLRQGRYNFFKGYGSLTEPDLIRLQDGSIDSVYKADVHTFVSNFKSEWADSLVQFHPEYGFYLFCRDHLTASYAHDFRRFAVTEYDSAYVLGLLNPTNVTGAKKAFPYDSLNRDPFWDDKPSHKEAFNQKLLNFKIQNDTVYTIWDIAALQAFCSPTSDPVEFYPCIEAFRDRRVVDSMFFTVSQRNNFVTAFQSLYNSAKTYYIEFFMDDVLADLYTGPGGFTYPHCHVGTVDCGDYSNKIRRYYYGYSDGLDHTQSDETLGSVIADRVNEGIGADSTCYYASLRWMSALADCPYLNISDNLYDTLLNEMRSLCDRGRMATSPPSVFAVSSVPLSDTAARFHSIDEILTYYLGDSARHINCNANLLGNVYKAGHSYTESQANASCDCIAGQKIQAPPVVISEEVKTTFGSSCVKDSLILTEYGEGLLEFMNAMKDSAEQGVYSLLNTTFIDTLYPGYASGMKEQKPYGRANSSTFIRYYPGALASKNVYQWRLNFTDITAPESRCNIFFNIKSNDSLALFHRNGEFLGFTEVSTDTFMVSYRWLDESFDPPAADTIEFKGYTNCARVLSRICVESTTDTLYGTPFRVDSTQLDSFMLLARSIRNGTADSLMVDYMADGTCDEAGALAACALKPDNRTKDLIDVINEALYVGRQEPGMFNNVLHADPNYFNGFSDGNGGLFNFTMDRLSPTYVEKFALEWSRYDGYRALSFPSADANEDCFDDANVYHDPYFKGIAHFGIGGGETQEIINCKLSFGDPYLSNFSLSALDTFFNYRIDSSLGMWVVDAIEFSSISIGTGTIAPVVYTLTVMSCFDEPVCSDFAYSDTGNYNRTYVSKNQPEFKYSFSCSELNRYYESQHDFTCDESEAGALMLDKKFTPFFLQKLLNLKAKTPDGGNPGSNMLVKQDADVFDPAGMPETMESIMTSHIFQAEFESDSLLMIYLGDTGTLSGCQLSLRLLSGDSILSFGHLDSFYRIRADDEKLREYYEQGNFNKGKHYFLINGYNSASGHTFKFRGWLSCTEVYDCVQTGAVNESISDNRCGCATCPEIKAALDSFMVRYDSLPVNNPLYERMITNFLNNELNNNLTYTEYEHFMAQCNLFADYTYSVADYDILVRSFNYSFVLDAFDQFINGQQDSFGFIIHVSKVIKEGTDSLDISLSFNDMADSERAILLAKFKHYFQNQPLIAPYSRYVEHPVSPCGIWARILDSSSCRADFISNYNTLVKDRFGLDDLTEETYEVFTSDNVYPDYSKGGLYKYCINVDGKTQQEKLAIYHVIDSLLGHCPYTEYGTSFSRRQVRSADTSAIRILQYDTNYISIKGPVCESCNDLYAKILKYHDYTYKYRREHIREAALPENIQSNLYNWYGYQTQVFELSPADARSTQNDLAVCALNHKGEDLLFTMRQMQHLSSLYDTENLDNYPQFNENSLFDVSPGAPDAYFSSEVYFYNPDSVLSIFMITQGNDTCRFSLLTDSTLLNVDSIFGIEAYPGDTSRFILIAGFAGTVYRYTGVSSCYSLASCCNFIKPALCFRPGLEIITPDTGDCRRTLTDLARSNALQAYNEYSDSLRLVFNENYTNACLDSAMAKEKIGIGAEFAEYHFTLYYYDLAGNLVKTVPPAGTDTLNLSPVLMARIKDNLVTGNPVNYVFTNHTLNTNYRYNSLGQVRYQKTPDAGESTFYYDLLGRLVLSQNSRQKAQGNVYSYTIRDGQNRITETGEIVATAVNEDSLRYGYATWYPAWLSSGYRTQITRTYYDSPYSTAVNNLLEGGQQYLRNRVSTVAYFEYNTSGYNYATHYSYDVHGNVQTLVQDYPELEELNNRYKYLHYHYDLVSGKVNMVRYQPGQPDRFYHRYRYDADNRLTSVYTSTDSVIWDCDAGYNYYKHGPLARMELGEHEVQGVDYAYTIHGWLKGVNSTTLHNSRDMGLDGNTASNPNFARDVYGFTLGYYQGDYKPIDQAYYNSATAFLANTSGSPLVSRGLFNGNISHMTTAIQPLMENNTAPMASVYNYDQLNRITQMATYSNLDIGTNSWNSGSTGTDYLNTFGYDPNGNIKYQFRASLSTATYAGIDSLYYQYTAGTNRLDHVNDSVPDGHYNDDIDNQQAGNYIYDATGNLVKDKAEGIDTILWNVYGKIRHIKRDTMSTKPELEFKYDASGQRVVKIVKNGSSENNWIRQYYVRDAQGNIMATYRKRSFIQDDAMNMAQVTNWIIDNKNEDSLAAIIRDNFYTNSEFINYYITSLDEANLGGDIIYNNYSLATILGWDNNLAGTAWINYELTDVANQQELLEDMVYYAKDQVIGSLSDCGDPAEFLNAMFTNDGVMLSTLDYLCNNGYSTHIYDLCIMNGVSPTGSCNDMALSLLSVTPRSNVVTTLLGMIPMGIIRTTLQAFVDHPTLISILDVSAGNYDFNSFRNAVYNCLGNTVMADFFSNYYSNESLAKQLLIAGVDEAVLLNYAAVNDTYNFTLHMVLEDNDALNDVLMQLNNFDVAKYMNFVKVRWGQEDYQELVSNMVFTQQLKLNDHHLYGSSRLGVRNADTTLFQREILLNGFDSLGQFLVDDVIDSVTMQVDTANSYRMLALKNYELSNHLGNVLAVINDKKSYHNSNTEYLNETYSSSYGTMIVNSNATLSLSSGKLSVSSTTASQIAGIMPKIAPAGKTYRISFDVTLSGGVSSVDLQLISDYATGSIQQDYHATTSNGTHTYTVNAPNGIYRFKFFGTGTGTYTIDNFSIREYETDSVYYTAEVVSASDYSAFGAPLHLRSFRPEAEPVVTTIDQDNFNTAGGAQGWQAEGSGTTLTNYYGNLKATTSGGPNKGMKKTFATVPGKNYRIVFGLNTRGFPMLYVNDKATGLELLRSSDILVPKEYNYTFTATGLETEIKLLEVIQSANDILLRYFNFEEVVETNGYIFGFNSQERDDEVSGTGNSYTAEFWQYDPRLGRRFNIDPKPNESISSYACFANNPIWYCDPDGDTVRYGGFGDWVNSTLGRIFNREFSDKFKEWKNSQDVYTIQRDRGWKNKIVDAKPDDHSALSDPSHHAVFYRYGFGIGDMSNSITRSTFSTLSLPFSITYNIGKLGVGALSGLVLAPYSLLKHGELRWGAAGGVLWLSPFGDVSLYQFGLGNYNTYNAFGGPYRYKKLSPANSLVGLRWGIGKKYPINNLSIGQSLNSAHLHLNLTHPRRRNFERNQPKEGIIDFRTKE
jgi:hypothetical protein